MLAGYCLAMTRLPWNIVDPQLEQRAATAPQILYQPGHYFSPLPDTTELTPIHRQEQIWPDEPPIFPGIDWRNEAQVAFCENVLAAQERIAFSQVPAELPREFFYPNDSFPVLDAWILEGMLRHYRPRRMIEVGSGMSSLVTAQVNREYFGGDLHFTCIEPYPLPHVFNINGVSDLRVELVQDTPLELFQTLESGDVLFIDSSHTVKTGGDVTFLLNTVVPRLAPGVIVHIHDIYLPTDYPKQWVFQGRGWNEQYLIEAFLNFNSEFEILLGAQWMVQHHPEIVERLFGISPYRGGGSLWIQRKNRQS